MLPKLLACYERPWIDEDSDIDVDMGNDNCGCLGGWSLARGGGGSGVPGGWAALPDVPLHRVFRLLSARDRLAASATCRRWRAGLYHPSFWQHVTFPLTRYTLPRHTYLAAAAGHLVRHADVRFHSLADACVYELAALLQRLAKNRNLRTLQLHPSHCHMHLPPKNHLFLERCMVAPLLAISTRLSELSLGCCEDLCAYVPQLLQSARPAAPTLRLLGLASMKDDPGSYLIPDCAPHMFLPYVALRVLSVDYDYMTDALLALLPAGLERLVVHVHGLWAEHPGTTPQAWERFVQERPQCQLRLTLIHAYEAVQSLHDVILQPAMPLTHLKVLFCEDLNLRVFNLISSWYSRQFRSLMWVDSQSQESTWALIRSMGDGDGNHPDPLVMAAWLCPRLEEIVLLGYKYFEEDLVGVARLCENKLRRLEVADDDVIYSHEVYRGLTDSKEEISKVLGRPWAPLQSSELHPVISNPTAGDSDEYLLPIVLADLR